MRSIRAECLSAAIILSVPLGVVLAFPFGAFQFRAVEGVRRPARAAFVTLTPGAEWKALKATRASWQGNASGARRLRANLFCSELPDDGRLSVLSLRDRSHPPAPPSISRERTPFLPSQKAPPPAPLAAETTSESLAFPREELLKMN